MTWEVCLQEDPLKHSNVNVQMKPICSYERLRFLTKGLVTQKMAKVLVKKCPCCGPGLMVKLMLK